MDHTLYPSTWLFDFLKSYEHFRPTAYKPTPKDKWTLGWGHTDGVNEGDTCDSDTANTWLHNDVSWATAPIHRLCTVPLTQPQFDALVSLVFNIGVGHFEESTLLRKLNDSDYGGAAAEFLVWDEQAGQVLQGLENRRIAERKRFETA
jgi:lysozyme